MEAPKAPAPPNPLAAMLGPAIGQAQAAAEGAAAKRHDELLKALYEIRDLLKQNLEA